MITITDKTNCCGCQACANICPKKCIAMKADEEGFLYPNVDKSACVKCGLCEKVCPILNKPQTFPILNTYAAKHTSAEVKLKSSSGGMFTALAEVILKEGGVVFGAAFDKEWSVIHTYAENLQDLDNLRRSKYVQSSIGNTYQQAKAFLEQGRQVLFTGTPCQIAGLRNFLRKEYDNLLTADLFCHGVPSPAVWQKFLNENTRKEKISAIDFRHKQFGWDASFLKISYRDGTYLPKLPFYLKPLRNLKRGSLLRRVYKLSFGISNLYERPSCHACNFKGLDKMADFSVGDLWGVQKTYPAQYDKQGTSALLVNTVKGQRLLNKCVLCKTEIDIEKVVQYNPYLISSVKPNPKRAEFFARYQNENFNKLVRELLNIKPLPLRLLHAIKCRLLRK